MGDLDTVKVVLRSLLISSTRPMTTYDLQKDFRVNEGYECPFVALGYRNFISFLQSIPDTVTVLSNGLVRAVTTEETSHIQRLVALQKRPKPRKIRSFGYGRSGSAGYRPSSSYSSARPSSSYSSARPSSSYSSAPPSSSYSSARPSSSYNSAHPSSSSYNSANPSSCSYSSSRPPRLVPSQVYLPPTARTSSYQPEEPGKARNLDNIFPPASYTIEQHFSKVRQVKEQARRDALGLAAAKRAPSPVEAGWSGEAFISKWKEQHAHEENSPPVKSKIVPGGMSSDDSDDSFYERFKEDDGGGPPLKGNCNSNVRSVNSPELDAYFKSSNTINEKLKSNLRDLIKLYPKGLMACVLPEKYEEKFGVSLQWNEMGYDSIIQMAHDLKDIIVCKRVQCGDWKLYDASMSVTENLDNSETVGQSIPTVPDSVKSNIYNIVKRYPSGIRIEQLVQLYQEHFRKHLSTEAPGFDNPESLFLSIQDTVIHLRYIRRECYIYPGAEPPQPAVIPLLEVDSASKVELGLYPNEVLGPKESYPRTQLPPNLESGDYMELRVAEVYNPHKFWVLSREHSLKLDSLMDELQDFYHDHGDKYVMPDSTITEGQCCAAKYEGEWHRATIQSIADMIEVIYVDYGTVAKVSRSELRFLHRDFADLPAQAIRATLCGIQPPKGRQRFSREANIALLELVAEKHLIGLVQRVENEEPFLELFLIDTTGEKDIHLNDVLVSQNHAAFKPDLLEASEQSEVTKTEQYETFGDLQSEQICEETLSDQRHQDLPSEETIPPNTATNVSSDYATSYPNNATTFPPMQFSTNTMGSVYPQPPPPGFSIPAAQTQTMPPAMNMAGMAAYGAMLNPALAANPAAYLSQMNAAFLMQQQQQQQALLLAYYQNLQSAAAASILNAQKMAAAAAVAAARGSGAYPSNPLLGSPLMTSQFTSYQSPASQTYNSTSKSYVLEENESSSGLNTTPELNDNAVRRGAKETSSRSLISEMSDVVNASRPHLDSNWQQRSCSSTSTCGDDNASLKKRVVRKKRSERRPSTPSQSVSPGVVNNMRVPLSHDEGEKQICRVLPMSEERFSSSSNGSDIVVDRLDELLDNTDSDSSTSCLNNAPDLLQNVANLSLSNNSNRNMTNFWKIVDICERPLHLFNVDQRAYVSTGELARKFTSFSTCDTLARVLKNKDIIIPYKKATRQEHLPLFSALDGCSEEILKCFDLSRNKNGSIIGTFHLTPLTNIPSVLIPLGTDIATVKKFQVLRDSFNPDERYWTQ